MAYVVVFVEERFSLLSRSHIEKRNEGSHNENDDERQ
jgi:hypothetical protein